MKRARAHVKAMGLAALVLGIAVAGPVWGQSGLAVTLLPELYNGGSDYVWHPEYKSFDVLVTVRRPVDTKRALDAFVRIPRALDKAIGVVLKDGRGTAVAGTRVTWGFEASKVAKGGDDPLVWALVPGDFVTFRATVAPPAAALNALKRGSIELNLEAFKNAIGSASGGLQCTVGEQGEAACGAGLVRRPCCADDGEKKFSLLHKAEQFYRGKAWGQAVQAYAEVHRAFPDGAPCHRFEGLAYLRMGNAEKGLQCLGALAANTSDEGERLTLVKWTAVGLAMQGKVAEAETQVRAVIADESLVGDVLTWARIEAARIRGRGK